MTERELLDLQNQAITLENEEEFDKAIEILSNMAKNLSATEQEFEEQAVFYLLSRCYFNIEEHEKALEYYEISAKVEQCKGDAYCEMALIYKERGELLTAIECCKKALMAQHTYGEEVFNNYSAIEIWNLLAVTMMFAYNEDKTVDVHEILRHLREVLILDQERFGAYQNVAVCFSVLGEHKLQKEFAKIFKNQKIDDKKYQELFTALTKYCRDDNYPYYHFKINIIDEENRDCKPAFHALKDELTKLWNSCNSEHRLTLSTVFGQTDDLLSVTIENDIETGKPVASLEAQLVVQIDGEGALATLCYSVSTLYDLSMVFETYFYSESLYNAEQWKLENEEKAYKIAKRIKLLEPTVITPIRAKTQMSYCEITLSEKPCTRFDSKVGGEAYMPEGFTYPVSENGVPLRLLAQINFAEMPALPDFPTTGLLQFFILEDDLYGVNFDNLTVQNGFRVVYHETVDNTSPQQKTPSSCYNEEYYLLNPEDCLKMSFVKDTMMITLDDFRFYEIFAEYYHSSYHRQAKSIYDIDSVTSDALYEVFYKTGHRVSGYPYFAQSDPRDNDNHGEKDILLLQLDSEDVGDISLMWGDCGVANFFISREDLINRNFNNVLYTWDCG